MRARIERIRHGIRFRWRSGGGSRSHVSSGVRTSIAAAGLTRCVWMSALLPHKPPRWQGDLEAMIGCLDMLPAPVQLNIYDARCKGRQNWVCLQVQQGREIPELTGRNMLGGKRQQQHIPMEATIYWSAATWHSGVHRTISGFRPRRRRSPSAWSSTHSS